MAEQKPERPSRKPGRAAPPNGGMRFGRGLFGWVLFIGLAIMLFMLLNNTKPGKYLVSLSDFQTALRDDKVKSITIEGDEITGEYEPVQPGKNGNTIQFFRTPLPTGSTSTWDFTRWVLDN